MLEPILFRIHELFYLVSAFIPFLSLMIIVYFALIYAVKRSKRNKLVCLIVLVINLVKYTDHWVSFRTSAPENGIELNVLTWNVQRLGALSNNQVSATNLKQLSMTLNSSKADVIVIQEISKGQTFQLINHIKMDSKNMQWSNYYPGSKGGLAILLLEDNDWSLSNKQITDLPPSWKCVYSELKHSTGQKVNIFGVHIAPPKVTAIQVTNVTKKILLGQHSGIKNILRRYVRQAKIQTKQVDKINNLVSKFNDPTIIAGDFNSTCQLPLHRKIRENLNDTWLKGGVGIGATRYWAGVLPFRIDYIYATKNIEITTTNIGKSEFSDHNPVFSKLFIKEQKL
jgi:vancomycin resistance protein VanJ